MPALPQRVAPESPTGGNKAYASGEVPLSIDPDNPVSVIDGIFNLHDALLEKVISQDTVNPDAEPIADPRRIKDEGGKSR